MTSNKKQAPESAASPGPLGIPGKDTLVAFQTEVFKELINKLAWALGSTYRQPYGNLKTDTRQLAIAIAKHVIDKQGYPEYMRK